VFACKQTVVYVVDASRAASVLLKHFGEEAQGRVSSDRFSAYLMLSRLRKGIINSFCWAHFRRDFIKAGKEYKDLQVWSEQWLTRVRQLYRLNRLRLAALQDDASLLVAQSNLEQAIHLFRQQLDAEFKVSDLHPKQRTILKNARKNWEALIVFVAHPHVPMDNNRAERLLRLAALGRKNYYGCHAEWSGAFTAICLTLFQTAALHGLNIEAYMRYILDELADHPHSPQDLDLLLPWCIPESKMQAYHMRSGGSPCKNTTFPETSAAG
jgi:transposase